MMAAKQCISQYNNLLMKEDRMNLEIYNELEDKALELEDKAQELETRAEQLRETSKFLLGLVNGTTDFIVDKYGTTIDTASVIPEITIRPAKRGGGGFVADFGEFGGVFRGLLGGFIGNYEIHQAIKVIAKIAYRNMRAYIKEKHPDTAVALPENVRLKINRRVPEASYRGRKD